MAKEITLEELCNEPLPVKDNQTATPEPLIKDKDNLADITQKEVSTPEGGQGTPAAEAEVTPYTAEDLKSIPLERLDSQRIPENVRPFYDKALDEKKSLQAGFTQKAQELAEMKKRIESGNQAPTVEQLFDQNPVETMKRINSEIAQRRIALAEIDPILSPDEERGLKRDMAKLENLKEDLNQRAIDNRMRMIANEEMRVKSEALVSDTMAAIKGKFKEYDTLRPEIEKFAFDQGYTEQEIGILTDPRIVGKEMSMKNFKTIHDLYQKSNAGKTADGKLVPKSPNQLERDRVPPDKGTKKDVAESYEELDKYLTSKKL